MENKEKTVEDEVREYEERTGITLDAHNKATLREVIKRENRYWEKEAIREDSHGPVGDLFNAGNRS